MTSSGTVLLHRNLRTPWSQEREGGTCVLEDGPLEEPLALGRLELGGVTLVLRTTGKQFLELAGEVPPDGLVISAASLDGWHPCATEDVRREVAEEGHRVRDRFVEIEHDRMHLRRRTAALTKAPRNPHAGRHFRVGCDADDSERGDDCHGIEPGE